MEKFDIKNLTPEMCAEIKACESTEALKAYFASKNIAVPEDKLEAILTLCSCCTELDMEDLAAVSGGCSCDDADCGGECKYDYCWGDCTHDRCQSQAPMS